MPENFTMTLAIELQVDPANVSRIVKLEKTNSKYWPAIEALAMQTDPKATIERLAYLDQKRNPTAKTAA